VKDRGGVALQSGRFSGSQTYFPLSHGEAGYGIHNEEYVRSLRGKVAGVDYGAECSLYLHNGGFVCGGDDH